MFLLQPEKTEKGSQLNERMNYIKVSKYLTQYKLVGDTKIIFQIQNKEMFLCL